MAYLLHHTLFETANRAPESPLLLSTDGKHVSAVRFAQETINLATQLRELGLAKDQRVAVYLSKSPLYAYAFYAICLAGAIAVPISPVLKAPQVEHILQDCTASVLITSPQRLQSLESTLIRCPALRHVLLDSPYSISANTDKFISPWQPCGDAQPMAYPPPPRIDHDVAALLYTSGSTGRPKGVVVTHRNLVEGARSVVEYLEIQKSDRLLAVLPLSFDYGLNQLTTCVLRGASCLLYDYLFPRDVPEILDTHRITGLAGVPPLWTQLANVSWPEAVQRHLRFITNSGGVLPGPVLQSLRKKLPSTRVFLMYGLTEAFRSTFLAPELIDERQDSIGKPIPNVEILVVREDGQPAQDDEPGELVHRGALVTRGYWNDPQRTALRYKPLPTPLGGVPDGEIAVWSGDIVKRDKDGFLYFLGRNDAMIKTSGYRVSPEEIEEEVYKDVRIETAIAFGVPDDVLGQRIVVLATPKPGLSIDPADVLKMLRVRLPQFMHPASFEFVERLPRNSNGKLDRTKIAAEYLQMSATSGN